MATETTDTGEHNVAGSVPPKPKGRFSTVWSTMSRVTRREWVLVLAVLLVAAAIRLLLAARGWPYVNSDEATLGLMADDILWHAAHPLFSYGDHHIGAIDAYLQALFFAVLGSTDLVMHIVTTIQVVVFLVFFYLFTREVFSTPVAIATLLLLAFCGQLELFYEVRANRHAQDILVFSALLLWLVVWRLRHPERLILVDFAIGVVAGIGLWSSLLTLPFAAAAALALGVDAVKTLRRQRLSFPTRRQILGGLLLGAGLLIGVTPIILAAVNTRGSSLREGLLTASVGGHSVQAIIQQLGGTFIYAVPSMFDSGTVCSHCVVWPSSGVTPPPGQILEMTAIGVVFSGIVIGCWLLGVLPLVRDAWRSLRHRTRTASSDREGSRSADEAAAENARWWGRAMLAIGVGLTVLEFAAGRASFVDVGTNTRYLMGIYFVVPFIAAPLCSSVQTVWSLLRRRSGPQTAGHLELWLAPLGVMLLLAIFGINLLGEASLFQQTFTQPSQLGVPAGTRDVELLDFLSRHHATRFYTTYWVCYRLMFDSQEHADCYVVSNSNPFTPGVNKDLVYMDTATAAPHPAYVFDLTTTEVNPRVPIEIGAQIAAHAPRFAGYIGVQIAGYAVFYYTGPG
jgi:Dolichyl-phosphate-mannose-protein mannosyltransferase